MNDTIAPDTDLTLHLRDTLAREGLSPEAIGIFRTVIYDYYHALCRSLPWRTTFDPYLIFVSEVMLQQTQAERVIPKYEAFVAAFPDFKALAEAPFERVLGLWQGLGYNRRALALQKSAQLVVEKHGGMLPPDPKALVTFPGIGKATAASICAFAFDSPTVFIETNIRAVYIYFFFEDEVDVTDLEIRELVEATLDLDNPREWYFALMDYGVRLKKEHRNPARRSAHYKRQSPLEGSDRQLRGRILKALLKKPAMTSSELKELLEPGSERMQRILDRLLKEGMVKEQSDVYSIP